MRDFAEILAIATDRKGLAAIEVRLITPLTPEALAQRTSADWLEAMARAIFQAGFSWTVIETKWPGFQAAFKGFDPAHLAFWQVDMMDDLLQDARIVRNGAKISAVFANARFLQDLEQETGSAAHHLAHWPLTDQAGLVALFAKRGAHLGGVTGQRVCRMVGRDAWVLTDPVLKRLALEGIVEGSATGKAAQARIQSAFDTWHAESGRPFTQISQILAFSVD